MSIHHRPEQKGEEGSKILEPHQPKPPSPLKTLAVFVPFTASAIYLCWARLLKSGALDHLVSGCTGASYRTGSRLLDKFICSNVKFYLEALAPSNPPFFSGDVSSIAACALIPLVESLRSNTPKIMRYPVVTGLAAQTFGRGAIYPLYWSAFISSGAARKEPSKSTGSYIHQYEAEGALVASLLGFVLPGLGMSITKSAHWTLAWFIYPISLSIIQKSYSFLRRWLTAYHPPHEISQKRAYHLLQISYFLQFLYATSMHIKVLGPRLFNPEQLKQLMGVTLNIPSINTTTVSKIAYQVIQWDGIVLFASSVVATFAFARTKKEAAKIALFDLLATAACGTGGALAGIWAWRERRLHDERAVYHEVMRGV